MRQFQFEGVPDRARSDAVINWMFDVDEDDEYDFETPLLEELEIDIGYITSNILWSFMSPWRLLCAYNRTCRGGHHPFQKISNLSGEATIDFWGPWLVVSAYGAVLWLARVNNVPWVYAIWILTATFNHLICRVWYLRSSILFHCALLGYSLAPAVPLAALVCLMRSWEWLAYLLQYVTVLSAAVPAVLAYQLICGSSQHFATNSPVLNGAITSPLPSLGVQGSAPPVEKKAAVGLLVPPVILMLLYLVSLLPV